MSKYKDGSSKSIGNFGIAFVIYKITMPLRLGVTASVLPIIVKIIKWRNKF